jgi:hypothetical protein
MGSPSVTNLENHAMSTFDPTRYPPALAELLSTPRLNPLGPGEPNQAARAKLETLADDRVFQPQRVVNHDMANACRAGLWLYHDFFDESHKLSQDIDTIEGSYWHGILHRREPDASNAAYWFRRVGHHPIFEQLAREAHDLGLQLGSEWWDPFVYIDLCEKLRGTGCEQELLLRHVQQREWELLFDWCFGRATSK